MKIQEIKNEIAFLMQWLHDHHDPHSKLIISQTKVDLIQELEGYTSYNVFEQEEKDNLLTREKHRCEQIWNGQISSVCYENNSFELILTDVEADYQVNFCPHCGYESINKIKDI
jgi:hypothetical protein